MAESSRRFRNSTSRSIAASSAIALALGSISVVGPGPLAPSAAAAELTGGIRDKSGAVDKAAQQESDLPAGSCVVKSEESSGSQAGFSWDHLEPGGGSPSKTLWGLSVAFDNSKDRTFADWNFTNTGSLGTVLNTGTVPSMEAGTDFPVKPPLPVTAKADESIDITTSGRGVLRNLNLYAELTDEKVKQFASASADNPVRYAWQSNYKQDNDKGPAKATEGGSASFGATVNPWPSENIECNPIKVSWGTAEVSENHVIVPGEETKVGTINVPALQNSGEDDSMSRMVVEAYDGNGKFIGTTDPEASGGDQLLRIDEPTGDIYFTWPEYRGTDLATDKNVNFSVLAKPRTVGQLQAATEHNTEGGNGKAFDSSNSLTRYNTANVIDSTSFSLDDTEYHDPKYDKTDASIISGVDSATGPLATEPQKVTFTQTPDLIKELAKKKDQQGFEAKATLDEKYVYEGWTVEMDEDYNVTVTAPENPRPGTFARPKVIVEYSNGSTDELELLVVVDPNNTQVTDLVRPGLTKGTIGDDLTAQVGTKSIMKGYKPVHPAKFEIDKSTVPEGWTVTVDDTGKVTAKADDTVAPGTIITPTVKATYLDDTTDEIETQFQAIVDIKVPTYDTVANKPGTDVSLTPTVPERGLSGNTTDEAPTRYTFENNKTELTVEDEAGTWTVKIDENTGEITTSIPRTAPEGHVLNIPVLAYYSDEKPQQVKGTVVVLKGDIAPVYSVESTGPNKAVDHQVQDAPVGSTFSFGTKSDGSPLTEMTTEDGWKYTIDPKTGVVTSTPPAGSKPGDKKTITVDVVTPSGATPKVPVTTVVKLTNSWEAEPNYPSETVYPGETATSSLTIQKPEGVEVAKENPYAIQPPEGYKATGDNNKFGNPTYTVTTENGDWIVGLDDKGNVVATAPKTAKPGDTVNVPVKVTYSDKSTDDVTASIVVEDNPTRPIPFGVEYVYDDTIPAGEYKTVTKGVAGEEKQKRDGTWEQTTAPTNEVVHIGTKPATASKDVTWTAPIPYSTTTRPNPALAPGETKVVQQGVNGERTYTAKFTATGDQASVVESEDTKQAVEEIIEYGPRLDDQELVTETTRKIPFETTIVYDNTLEAGTQVVDTQGVIGEETVTSTQKLVDGKPSGDPVVETTTVTPKQDAVIRVGTKTEGQTTETVEAAVPFGVKIEFDPNMPAGTSETVTEGKPGKKTITVTQKVTNSQPDGEATVEEKITEQPVDQVIKVGTKPSEASAQVTWTASVPFEVETRPNSELKPGEIKVVQQGVPGEKTYTADFAANGSDATVTPKEEQTKAPVKEIIEYGPRLDDQNLVTTVTKPVPFETEIVFDDSLDSGKQEVKQEGKLGEDTVTSTQKLVDGKPSGDPVVETKRTEEPVKQIIRVGTKTEGANAVEHTEPVPYETKVEYDPNMPAGTYEVVTPGKAGEKTVTVTQTIVNSQVTDTKREENVTAQPVTEVIKVGTKQATATDKVEWTEPIPFSTVVRPNPDLKPGEVKTVQEGKNGEAKYTATFEGTNGQATVTESKDRTEPTDKIVEYGPTIADQTLTSTTTNPVPFNTTFVTDPNLPAGEQVVDKQGENGVDTVTATQEIKDGKPVGEPTITTQRTKEPVDAVVRVGTKTEGQTVNTYETAIPFPVRVVYDPSLAPGESKVTQEGKPGTKKVTITQPVVNSAPNGEATVAEETVTEPTEQIVTVGTKPDEATNTATWTVDVPFKTVVRANPDLKPGEVKTVQEGEYGEKKFTADFSSVGADSKVDTKEEQTKEPKDQIVEYGPTIDDQTLTSETTRPVEFETEYVLDDTLPAGEQKVDQQGENGKEKITSTQEIKDGKPVGEPTITTEVTKPVKKAIIRVGTKPTTTTATTTEVTTSAVPTTVKETVTQQVPTTVPTTVTTPVPTTVVSVTTAAGTPTTVTETKSVPTTYTTQVVTTVPTTVLTTVPTTVPTTVNTTTTATSTVTSAPATTTVTEKPAPVTETVTVPFTTKTVWDPTLEPGQEIEDVAGVDGKVQVTVADGKSKVETVTNPVQRIVRVGSKPADGVEWTEETPFKVTVVLDAQLEAGKYETVQEGKPGRVIHRADGTEETTAATDHIIKVGTYKVITNPFEFTSVQPFGTTVRPNFELAPGERKIVQEGKAGLVRYRIDMKTGEVVKLEDSAAVERIVEYGPDASDDKAVTTVTRPVPFDTEVIEDPNLPEGTQVIAQGEVGEEVVTTVQGLKDGRPFGDPITKTTQTVAPTNAVIRVGTKKPDAPQPLPDFERIVELPFTTKIVWDPTLEPGVEVEDVKGAAGQVKIQVVNGEPTVNTVKEPVQRVVRVGSKPADDVEWTEEIPFQVQVRQNPELTRGESRVVQDGVPGLKRYVNGKGEVVTEPVDYIFEIGTKDLVAELTYSPVTLRPGQTADVEPSTGHVEGNRYRKLEWPEGWEGSVDPDTGKLRVTPPADAKPGTKVKLPVEVTDADGNTSTVEMEVAVADGEAVPTPTPEDDKASSDKARRCLANAFAANSPFLWLLPLGILGAVGYGVNEAFGPQIQQLNAQFDEAVRRNMPDFGVGHGVEKPEFVREIEGQVNAINQRFAPVAEQLQPVGIALGAIALLSLTGVLVAQACSEEGFDNGLTVIGSSKAENTAEAARSSKK